jgi:hypothetical protein
MKRLQIAIEPELDRAEEQRAEEEGLSKAEVIRRCVRERVKPLPLSRRIRSSNFAGRCQAIPTTPGRSTRSSTGWWTGITPDLRRTSFAYMRAKGISEALAFDGDFAAAGFTELRP